VKAGQSAQRVATAKSALILLATSDPVFAALCKRVLEAGTNQEIVAVSPSELLEKARQLAPRHLVLDADGQDVAALKALATKVMLVSDANIVFVSAYLAPGSAGLSSLLQSIPAAFVQKPQGPSSLSIADDDGTTFVAALQAALDAKQSEDVATDNLDAGWDTDESRPRRKVRAAHD
jgi:chemotaxis response regulator CheB